MAVKKIQYIFVLMLVMLSAVFTADTFAQDENTTYRIVNISVKGNRVYDSKTIVAYSGLRENMEIGIPSDETRESIRRLWKLGLFSNISLTVDKKFGRDVYLVITVDELPRIEGVDITGNDHFSVSEIKEKIGLANGEVVSEQKLKDVAYNLELYYAEDGYALASVKVDKLISASNEARIRIKIDEGKKLTVREISFEGNIDVPSKKLKGAMDNISEKVWWKFWDGARFEKIKFDEDKKLIEIGRAHV